MWLHRSSCLFVLAITNIKSSWVSAMVVDHEKSESLFKKFLQANTFTAIRESFELLCHSLEIDTKEYETVYEKLKAGVRIDEAVSLWKLLDNRAQQRIYENGNVSAQQKVKIRCYWGHLGYSIIRCDARNSFLRQQLPVGHKLYCSVVKS